MPRASKIHLLPAVVAAAALVMAGAVNAGVLYENPASDYGFNSTPIGYDDLEPHYAGNTFTLASASKVTGVNFAAWNASNDLIKAVSWKILDDQFGFGATLAQGDAAVSSNFNRVNFYNVFVTDSTFTIPDLNLGAGTYWLYLYGAITFDGQWASWDNTPIGTSNFDNNSGRTSGNTFRIYGEQLVRDPGHGGGGGGDPAGAVPEPAAWTLMIAGFGMVGAGLRRRRALCLVPA
jgi:hypothetical protein